MTMSTPKYICIGTEAAAAARSSSEGKTIVLTTAAALLLFHYLYHQERSCDQSSWSRRTKRRTRARRGRTIRWTSADAKQRERVLDVRDGFSGSSGLRSSTATTYLRISLLDSCPNICFPTYRSTTRPTWPAHAVEILTPFHKFVPIHVFSGKNSNLQRSDTKPITRMRLIPSA